MSYSYCAPCDLYFGDDHSRDQHVKYSDNHPECHFCGRHFLNNHILRNHKVVEENHFYCGDCDKDFESAGAIQVHLEFDPAHCHDPSNNLKLKAKCHEYGVDMNEERWEYELARELYPCGDGVDFSWKKERLGELKEAFGEGWDYADYYDHELVEYLEESPAYSYGGDSDSEEDEDDDEDAARKFTCPMCLEEDPKTICTTSCGHLFCATCAVGALKYTHQCPECDEPGEVCELRRVYVSDD